MQWLDDAYEKLLTGVATRASGRTLLLLVVALYGGVGLALPLAAGWSTAWLVAANVIATTFAGTLVLMWLAVRVQAGRRRNLIEWTTDLRHLDAAEFEWLVGEVFRREGWKVDETGQQGRPDGGIDLLLSRGHDRKAVQCKRWTSWQVGVDDVRSFSGALTREGLPTTDGVFVTFSSFTQQARLEARRLGLLLLDGPDLHARVEAVRHAEPCPRCGSPMLLDRSPRGWWFRCVNGACGGKRDLAREPGRAVDLLTRPPE